MSTQSEKPSEAQTQEIIEWLQQEREVALSRVRELQKDLGRRTAEIEAWLTLAEARGLEAFFLSHELQYLRAWLKDMEETSGN